MGRPGLTRTLKFHRLARALDTVLSPGFGDVVGRGALELLWDCVYETGRDYVGTADDIESLARWRGPKGALATALIEAGGIDSPGFIEQAPDRPDGHFIVHDLWDHAPDYVRKRRERELARERKGKKLRKSASESSAPNGGQCPPRGGQRSDGDRQRAPNGRTSTPTPAPTPLIMQCSLAAAPPGNEPGNDPCLHPEGNGLQSDLSATAPTPDAGTGIEGSAIPDPVPDEPAPGIRWPSCYALMSQFAQRMTIPEGQGLIRIARPDLIAEKREEIEREVKRLGVVTAAEVCYQQAISERRKRGIYWLSWFLPRLQETPTPGETAAPNAPTGCDPWDALLEEARENGGSQVVDRWYSRLTARVEGDELILTAPDRYVADFIGDAHLSAIREAAEKRSGLSVRLVIDSESPTQGGSRQ
jgi:hypothetical protein